MALEISLLALYVFLLDYKTKGKIVKYGKEGGNRNILAYFSLYFSIIIYTHIEIL